MATGLDWGCFAVLHNGDSRLQVLEIGWQCVYLSANVSHFQDSERRKTIPKWDSLTDAVDVAKTQSRHRPCTSQEATLKCQEVEVTKQKCIQLVCTKFGVGIVRLRRRNHRRNARRDGMHE